MINKQPVQLNFDFITELPVESKPQLSLQQAYDLTKCKGKGYKQAYTTFTPVSKTKKGSDIK